jgi:hypothetical protein
LAAVQAAQAQQAVQRAEDYLNLINDKKHHLTVHISVLNCGWQQVNGRLPLRVLKVFIRTIKKNESLVSYY